MNTKVNREPYLTSPRLRGEVGLQSNPGEGIPLSPHLPNSRIEEPLTPTLSPQARGEGAY
jgi:hypothetical protein